MFEQQQKQETLKINFPCNLHKFVIRWKNLGVLYVYKLKSLKASLGKYVSPLWNTDTYGFNLF